MSAYDYSVATQLASNKRITFESLIMAAALVSERQDYAKLRDAFRFIIHDMNDIRLGQNTEEVYYGTPE